MIIITLFNLDEITGMRNVKAFNNINTRGLLISSNWVSVTLIIVSSIICGYKSLKRTLKFMPKIINNIK